MSARFSCLDPWPRWIACRKASALPLQGGGVYVYDGHVTFKGLNIYGNTATGGSSDSSARALAFTRPIHAPHGLTCFHGCAGSESCPCLPLPELSSMAPMDHTAPTEPISVRVLPRAATLTFRLPAAGECSPFTAHIPWPQWITRRNASAFLATGWRSVHRQRKRELQQLPDLQQRSKGGERSPFPDLSSMAPTESKVTTGINRISPN